MAQYLAPIEEREELKMKIVTLRRRYFKVLQELCKKKEIFRWLLPLLEQYRDQGCDIKSWLDVTESRTELITSNFNNNEIIVKNEDLIEVWFSNVTFLVTGMIVSVSGALDLVSCGIEIFDRFQFLNGNFYTKMIFFQDLKSLVLKFNFKIPLLITFLGNQRRTFRTKGRLRRFFERQ